MNSKIVDVVMDGIFFFCIRIACIEETADLLCFPSHEA